MHRRIRRMNEASNIRLQYPTSLRHRQSRNQPLRLLERQRQHNRVHQSVTRRTPQQPLPPTSRLDSIDTSAKADLPTPRLQQARRRRVKIAQRNGRNPQPRAQRRLQKQLPKHLRRKLQRTVRKAIVQGAKHHRLPKMLHRHRSLLRPLQPPVQPNLIVPFGSREKLRHPTRDGRLIGKPKHRRTKKGIREMQRRRQSIRAEHAPPPTLLQKHKFVIPAHLIGNARLRQQIDQIGAATQQHMLAIHHLMQRRMLIRRSPPTHIRLSFQQFDVESSARQSAGSRKASNPSAHNCHRRCYVWIQAVL